MLLYFFLLLNYVCFKLPSSQTINFGSSEFEIMRVECYMYQMYNYYCHYYCYCCCNEDDNDGDGYLYMYLFNIQRG